MGKRRFNIKLIDFFENWCIDGMNLILIYIKCGFFCCILHDVSTFRFDSQTVVRFVYICSRCLRRVFRCPENLELNRRKIEIFVSSGDF